ncbi:MAG: hypothetical protein GX621_08730 [Pirellulaceae bacterium]|nr:hypothetical protein [Pirellulaceae bacterium]
MPCYQVQTVSVEFKAKNRALLDAALDAIGATAFTRYDGTLMLDTGIVLDLERGTATIQEGQQYQLNALKRAYAAEALKQAAKQNGWTYTATTKSRGELRRSYT